MRLSRTAFVTLSAAVALMIGVASPAYAYTSRWSSWKVCNGPSALGDWSIRTYFSANSSGYIPSDVGIQGGTGVDPYYSFRVTWYRGTTIVKTATFNTGKRTGPSYVQYSTSAANPWPRVTTPKAVVALLNGSGGTLCTVTNT